MPKLLPLLLILLLSALPVFAQETTINLNAAPYTCPNSSGTYYQAGVFPSYDAATSELVLVDASGTRVRTLDTIAENVRIIDWSPDCHYLTGVFGRIGAYYSDDWQGQGGVLWDRHSLVIWDAIDGGRLQIIEGRGDYLVTSTVIWSPDSRFALLRDGCYMVRYTCIRERFTDNWIWRSEGNLVWQVAGWFNEYAWDLDHNRLWGNAMQRVLAYDLATGQRVADLAVHGSLEGRFTFSPDGTKIIVYGTPVEWGVGRQGIPVSIYDIASGTETQVDQDGSLGFHQMPYNGEKPVALSPDNRYLAVGYDTVRVWDLQNLSTSLLDQQPINRFAGPESVIQSLGFVAPDVIETTSDDGVQDWNMVTGVYVP